MPGLLLKQKRPIDTFKVQLIPLRAAPKVKIAGPEDVANLVREMEDYDRESAKIIHLDTKNQVMGIETISIGSLSASIIHPRETVKGAILNNSANVIFVHNHPSGVCEPSNEDIEISGNLKEAFETVSIVLLDSIIVGKGCHYSLRATGFISGEPGRLPVSGKVSEPRTEIKDKVEFINATTEYIKSGSDLERRNRAGEKIKASRYLKPWFEEFFYEHDIQRAKQNLMKFFAANEQGLGAINYTYYGVIQEYLGAISKPVPTELTLRENTVRVSSNREFRKSIEKTWDSNTVNNVHAFLTSRTVDTSKHSRSNPVPGSAVMGAAVPEDGYLAAAHVTDDPEGVIRMLRSTSVLTEQTTVDDLGSGFYGSGVPEYWRVRSREKWDFAKNLNRAQRQALVTVILSDPNYRKGGGYLADFEVDYLNRDLKLFVETGDVNILAGTGSQPYNVEITADIARKAGVPVPKKPGMVKIKLQGKFINAEGLYFNPEIGNRARDWAGSLEGRKKIAQWFVATTPKNIVNAWLRSLGYSGAFTKSGFSTNPEIVIWDRKAIIDFRIPELRG